jgi:hypothetical protein
MKPGGAFESSGAAALGWSVSLLDAVMMFNGRFLAYRQLAGTAG